MTSEDGTSRIEDDAGWAAATLRLRSAPARRSDGGSPWPHRIALAGTLLLHVFLIWVLQVASRVPEPVPPSEEDVLELVLIDVPPPSPPEPTPTPDSPDVEQAPVPPVATPAPRPVPTQVVRRRRAVRDAPMTAVDVAPSTTDAPKPRLFRVDGGVNVDANLAAKIDAANDAVVEYRLPNLEKAGRFLRPPPIDYEPTSFDKYWVPDEDLLQEWTRRSVRKVAIPIPGSRCKIVCAVALLAAGGSCGVDCGGQPHNARPPPDIPPPGASSSEKLAKPAPKEDATDPCIELRRARDVARTRAEFEYQMRRAQQQGCR